MEKSDLIHHGAGSLTTTEKPLCCGGCGQPVTDDHFFCEKPLHVQVAEALGWTDVRDGASEPFGVRPPNDVHWGAPDGRWSIPRYDIEWGVTGPLLESYKLWVQPCAEHAEAPGVTCRGWVAVSENIDAEGAGATALEAICRLILALKAAGKLEAA